MDSAASIHIAITTTLFVEKGCKRNHLVTVSRAASIPSLLESAFRDWNLQVDNVDNYGLKLERTGKYLSEGDIKSLETPSVLELWYSPTRVARKFIQDLRTAAADKSSSAYGDRVDKLKALKSHFDDEAILCVLLKLDAFEVGVKLLETQMDAVVADKNVQSISMILSLVSALAKQDGEIVREDHQLQRNLSNFLVRLIEYNLLPLEHAGDILGSCLTVVNIMTEQRVRVDSEFDVGSMLPTDTLLKLLYRYGDNINVQKSVITSFNRIYSLSNPSVQQKMRDSFYDHHVSTFVCQKLIAKDMNSELKKEILMLQTLLLRAFLDQSGVGWDCKDRQSLEQIKELRRLAFERGSKDEKHAVNQRGRFSDDYKSLGFFTFVDPSQDFRKSPSGKLALNLMSYFALKHTDSYNAFISDNSCCGEVSECPFGAGSIALVELICNILRGKAKEDAFLPCFFSHEDFLGEFFTLILLHLGGTWREMQAKIEDLDKVVEVAREQVTRSLRDCPLSLAAFKSGLRSFAQVSESWKESVKTKTYSDLIAIQELRKIMRPDVVDLIQRQRLTCLEHGDRFYKMKKDGNRDRNKISYFCKLSPNHKNLYHGEWPSDGEAPSIEQLSNRILVKDIKDVITGEHAITGGRNTLRNLSIMITCASSDSLELVTVDQRTFDFWCDGLNCLMRRDMKSSRVEEQLESFLSLEIKLKLLHLNGMDISPKIPEIPPLPTNYDFYHHY